MTTLDKPTEYKVIGTSPLRHDGVDKVTGRAAYGADIRLPGMLYGAVLRSPHAHAKIISIDTSEAEKLHGVHAVITAKDLPDLESKVVELGEGVINRRYQSNNVLARDMVLYFGHAVAACTVLVDGKAIYSCMALAVEYEGKSIETIESLEKAGSLHPIQQDFIREDALQCGFCTPGQIMSAKALLEARPNPQSGEIEEALAGNLCRCGAYPKIFEAVREASRLQRQGRS